MLVELLDRINYLFFCLLFFCSILLVSKFFYHIFGLFPAQKFKPARRNHRYAIIIPARNESVVIANLIKSIATQNYDANLIDTYVIVENESDPTLEICRPFSNVFPFVRPNLDVKRKGGAMDQCFKHLLQSGIAKNKGYEAYFIFDADNILDANYIKEMNKVFDKGYQMALGYRNSKNWNGGWVASCSALMFSMINTFQNKSRARFNQNVMVSGTGFYISAEIITKLGGWPFQTLTEDYEFSLYATINNLHSTYCEAAEYFDEQPVSIKVSWNQRLRWVRGYNQAQKKYSKRILKSMWVSSKNRWRKFELSINILPLGIAIGTVFTYILFMLGLGFYGVMNDVLGYQLALKYGLIAIGASYLSLVAYVIILLLAERKHTNLTFVNVIKTIIMFPIFLFFFIPIVITSMLKKEVVWTPIEHNVNVDIKK